MSPAPAWPVTLKGPRVLVRSLTEADLPTTLAWRNHESSRRFFKSSAIIDVATHYAWFHSYAERRNEYMFYFTAIESSAPIGQGGIYALDEAGSRAEVGRFVSDPALRGRGLFREGLILMLEFARAQLNLREVHLEVLTTNERAIRLYRSLGFLRSGGRDSMTLMRLPMGQRTIQETLQLEPSGNA